MKRINLFAFLLFFLIISVFPSFSASEKTMLKIIIPEVVLNGIKTREIKIVAEKNGEIDPEFSDTLVINGIKIPAEPEKSAELRMKISGGELVLKNALITGEKIEVTTSTGLQVSQTVFSLPGFISLLPPIIAILMAFFTHNVIISIFSGIWIGLFFIYHYNPLSALIHFFDKYLLETLADKSHLSIIMFCLALGGIIKIVTVSGGVEGIVGIVTRYADTRKKGLLSTWFMGLLLFFDDYASALLTGNTMRPYTDTLKISREKLSYLVDVMAAPVSCLAVISTWIGFQLGQIETGMGGTTIKEFSAYDIFISSLPYNFYCIFAIIFAFLLILFERDFGPMLKAEKRAISEGKVAADHSLLSEEKHSETITPRALNAIVPILSVILVTIFGILITGTQALEISFSEISLTNLREVMASSSTSRVLLWAGIIGILLSIITVTFNRTMTLNRAVETWVSGASNMMFAIMILCQAWTLSTVCTELNTNNYLIGLVGENLPLWALPLSVFLISALISFATGTSYGTMGIMFPLVIPLAVSLITANGLAVISDGDYSSIFLGVIGATFSGALFGDHCSPISDTTTMSAISSRCDLLDHFSTQLPYGIVVLIVSAFTGFIFSALNGSPWLAIFLGLITLSLIVFFSPKTKEIK